MPPTSRPLGVEKLEDRCVPAQFGNPWPHADRITISFAPDGTDVAGAQSVLSSALGGVGPEGVWKAEIARAFQTWAAVTNVNFAVVSDNGKPFGEPGPVQGSEWFGDVRISARPLSDDVIAVGTPFDMFNNWAGEIVLNSNKGFSVGGANGGYDLYTVMLQEAGHALGLANSTDPAAAMFTRYSAPRTGLASADVAAVQALYGVRAADRFDTAGANDTLSKADTLTFVSDASKQLGTTDGTDGGKPLVAVGDITTLSDVDYYAYKTPKGSSDFTVSFLTSGLSQLNAKLSVYDSSGKLIKTAVATPPGDGKPFELFVGGTKADATYRVKVEAATQDVFGIGLYKLSVGKQSQEAVSTQVDATFDTATGKKDGKDKDNTSSLLTYVDLGVARPKTDARWDYTGYADVYTKGDVDVFKVRTLAGTPPVLVVSAWDTLGGKLDPLVTVYDATGNVVPAEVLQDDRGNYTIQITGTRPSADYYIVVSAADPSNSNTNTGKYFLGIDFRDTAVEHTTFAAGTLRGDTNEVFTSFDLTRTQSVWFELSGSLNPDVASRLTVYDADRVAVFTLGSKGGQVIGGSVFLQPGSYTVRIVAAARTGVLPAWDFRARYSLESDPIGPAPITAPAPTGSPNPTPTAPTTYTYDPATRTMTTFNSTSPVYTSPVGTTTTTDPLVWTATTSTTLYLATRGDIYSNPWGW